MTRTRSTTVSYHMLVEALRPSKVLREPRCAQRSFRWASSVRWERGIVPEKDMAIVCRDKAAAQAGELFPEAFLVVLSEEEDLADAPEIGNDAVFVQAPPDDNVLQKLQNVFLKLQAWHDELSGIAPSDQALDEVLRRSGRLMDLPLLLYGVDGRLASSSLINANLPACKAFEERKGQILDSISLTRRSPMRFQGSSGALYVEHRLVRTETEDLFFLLALSAVEPSPGTRDLLGKVAELVLEKSGKAHVLSNLSRHSVYALFDSLVNGRYVGKSHLDDYSSLYGFSLDSEFRLVRFKQDAAARQIDPGDLAAFARKLNGGKCLATVYGGDLCALLHSTELDSSLSTETLEEELEGLGGALDGYVAVSQVFNGLANLAFAYQQTDLIASYRPHIDFARTFAAAEDRARKLCYTFEEALVFALVDSDAMTQEMKDFAFSHTILEKIIAEDAANGGEDARILSSYLHYERKATVVAEKLHMHRNTVLYRIGKIEKRFGLDFDQGWSRDRVMLDFSILYCKLMRDDGLRAKLFGNGG